MDREHIAHETAQPVRRRPPAHAPPAARKPVEPAATLPRPAAVGGESILARGALSSRIRRASGGTPLQSDALQRLATAGGESTFGARGALSSRIRRASGGTPLQSDVQRRLEGALDADLSAVRIQHDGRSDQLARDVDAVAFTSGSNIFFRRGAYEPSSREGFETLAHEVVHTVQQSHGPVAGSAIAGGVRVSDPGDRDEREASATASRIARSTTATAAGATAATDVQRRSASKPTPGPVPVQRLAGTAMNLLHIAESYDPEQAVQRSDLKSAVVCLADSIIRWKTLKDAISVVAPADAAALTNAKALALVTPPQTTAEARAPDVTTLTTAWTNQVMPVLAPMDQPTALAHCTAKYNDKLLMAQREEIVVDANGILDLAALAGRLVIYDTTVPAQTASLVTYAGNALTRHATHATQPGQPVDTTGSVTHQSGNGWEIFVVGEAGDLHMASHKIGKFHHSSLLAGRRVAMAGEMRVHGGGIVEMTNKSGHYAPDERHFTRFLRQLQSAGNALNFTVSGFSGGHSGAAATPIPSQLASAWMAGVHGGQQPELLDTKTVYEAFVYAGHDPDAYLFGVPPAGLGWRFNNAVPDTHRERPDGAGGWIPVTHDEVRTALEAHWGPAQKRTRKKRPGPVDDIRWE
jgi:hypothetical protein